MRCYRVGKHGGGVVVYLRDDLTGEVLGRIANGVCEVLVVFIHQLNNDTRLAEFTQIL